MSDAMKRVSYTPTVMVAGRRLDLDRVVAALVDQPRPASVGTPTLYDDAVSCVDTSALVRRIEQAYLHLSAGTARDFVEVRLEVAQRVAARIASAALGVALEPGDIEPGDAALVVVAGIVRWLSSKRDNETCRGGHAWERPSFDKVRSGGHNPDVILYKCATCGAYGWAPPTMPSRIRAYVGDGYRRWLPKTNEPPTAMPKAEREHTPAHIGPGEVDRRRPPKRRSGKADYEPTHTLDDWDRERKR